MNKLFKETLLIIFGIILIVFLYVFYNVLDLSSMNIGILSNKYVGIGLVIIILAFLWYMSSYLKGLKKIKDSRYKDKLFNSLVKESDTIYFMFDKKLNKIIYMTKNVNQVLGNSEIEDKEIEIDTIKQIFEMPIVENELRSWDKKSEFISQMITYHNLAYQHDRWIKIKIYPIKEKKNILYIVLISNASKEHDQQHLLVSQASDIKSREQKLNQITSVSYDTEIDINLETGVTTYRNLKLSNDNTKIINYINDFNVNIISNVAEDDADKVFEILNINNLKEESLKSHEEPISVRYKLNSQDEKVWYESTVFFTTSKGERHAAILTKNVTENAESVRRQNILLQNALKEAKQANNAKSDFLATMSHEIRTPMNAIIGLSSSILEENIPDNVKEDVESINSASNNLLEIIDGILDISKVESGSLELDEKEYNIAKLFKDLESITKENIGKKNIKLVLNINRNIPSLLFGDNGKIRQVLTNILNNAAKFTDEGVITINADCERINSKIRLTISVEDTGIGMNEQELSKIFEDSNSKNMGLVISKKLIDVLKGQIEVESKVGIGSKFTIYIEQKIMDDKAIGDINEFKVIRKRALSFNAEGKKILVVDDNKLNLRVATKLLKAYGATIESVISGKECIDLINNGNKYDLILLDQMMPEMDGVETFKQLKMINDFNTPVVVLTADAIKGVKEKYLSVGFDDYLSKPIDVNELSTVLKKHLNK